MKEIDLNRIAFSEVAAETIFPHLHKGSMLRAILEELKPRLLARAKPNGDTYADLDGKIIELRLQEIAGGYEIVLRPKIIYTTAPVNFDGFGTKTVGPPPGKLAGTEFTIRKVEIYPENLEWQVWRYQNGMHMVWTQELYDEQKRLDASRKDGNRDQGT